MAKIQQTRPRKASAAPSALHQVRKKTHYAIGRGIIAGASLVNGVMGAWWFVDLFSGTEQAAIGYALALSVVLFWVLVYSVGQAFFDMADNAIRRVVQGDQQAMITANRSGP